MDHARLQNSKDSENRLGGINRKYQRNKVAGFFGDIADGPVVVGGVVEDVSSNGFKMSHVSDSFLAEKHSYTAVVSGNGKHYKILAKPCWKRKTRDNFEIGFKVVDAPWEWFEFILNTDTGQQFQEDWRGNA